MSQTQSVLPSIGTGCPGLDEILCGGLPPFRQYLIEGRPGTGKTTLALQFLLEGRRLGERCLYITLSETQEELLDVASSHGWTLDGLELYELQAAESRLRPEDEYTVFRPEDVELGETMQEVYKLVEVTAPSRVVFDSLSELRLLARDPFRYRRQILMLKQFFAGRRCTILLLDDKSSSDSDAQLQSISHGVISLERLGQEYGISRRRLNVVKLRGAQFRDGYHDYAIMRGGLRVYPRLVAAEHRGGHDESVFSAGIHGFDALLGGGLHAGTSTLIIGPAGTGKSTIAGAYLHEAARQRRRAAAYIFEETRHTYLKRMSGVGLELPVEGADPLIHVQQVDPAELAPGEFIHFVREEVERKGAQLIVIDSLNGYLNAMPNERFLMVQLHEFLSYLAERGVVTILVAAQHGFLGTVQSPVDVSYLADSVILTRYFEVGGAFRRAVSVIKHRRSGHEDTIRELRIETGGLRVGDALVEFRGVLSGSPLYTGAAGNLLKDER